MIKNFWKKVVKHFCIVVIPSIIAFLTFLTIFSQQLESSLKSIGIGPSLLIIVVIFTTTLIYDIQKYLNNDKVKKESVYENSNVTQKVVNDTINNIFRTVAAAIKFPSDSPKIVLHYFYHQQIDKDEFLVKDRRFCVEDEPRAIDFSLDRCRLNAKNMVMCEAFSTNRVIFKNLPSDHKENYDRDIKDYIDSDIQWVLACPVWKENNVNYKLGVVVIFGTSPISKENEHKKVHLLESIGVLLSSSISYLIEKFSE